jgi:ABC-2 type transport system permease protein
VDSTQVAVCVNDGDPNAAHDLRTLNPVPPGVIIRDSVKNTAERTVKPQPRTLKANLAILGELARTDLKIRFQGSFLGYLWTLLKPFAFFAVLYLVFTVFMRGGDDPYFSLKLLLGIIIWTFLSDCTLVGMNAFLWKPHLVTKVYVPRIIIVTSSTLVSFVLLLLNLVAYLGFHLIFGPSPLFGANAFLFIPYVLLLYCFGLGLALPLSVILVRIRDLQHIWEIVLQMGFWLTPIIWGFHNLPPRAKAHQALVQRVAMLNPMARIIEFSRHALVGNTNPGLKPIVVLVAMVGIVFLVGYVIFAKQESHIAERL